ncbi:MAG: mannose-1-phosphate guanylyltransferase [SAR324 cluster bacterium]|nr:mannose-1-phosphate guanylyltransferase [SAR324 cluster bacterium]
MEQILKNKNRPIIPVILSGGMGSRLWPLSREDFPKPFIRIDNKQSFIQKAYLLAAEIDGVKEIVTVTNRSFFFQTKDEYEPLSISEIKNTFILEPFGRNSAAAVALAGHYVHKKYGEAAIMLVLPADHIIKKKNKFIKALKKAIKLADQGRLTVFGIKPDDPNTGYGYIEIDQNDVKRFVEKPDLKSAQRYLQMTNYFWNSGISCLRVDSFLAELSKYFPTIESKTAKCIAKAKHSTGDNWEQLEISPKLFDGVLDISIDYAVFEKSAKIAVVPCDIGWSDIGTWLELGKLYPIDKNGNHRRGPTLLHDVKNCIIHSEKRLVAGIGLEDLIIVDTKNALLIAHKKDVQEVRKLRTPDNSE